MMRYAVLCLCLLSIMGCSLVEKPPVKPNSSRACVTSYQRSLAKSLRTVASEINDETTAEEANKRLGELWRDDRLRSFQPMTDRMQREIGGEKWDAVKAQKLFRSMANELDGGRSTGR